jgi:WD40 repeat protein
METLEKIKTLEGHKDFITTLAFSPDGSRLVTGSYDKTAIVWNMETFEQIKTLEGHDNWILTLAFNHDGSRLATGSKDKTAIVWNMETFEQIKRLEGHDSYINTLAFNQDGTRLVTGSVDKTAIVWNMETLTLPVPELLTETGALTNLRVCQDSFKVIPITPMPAPETIWVDESLPAAEALAACAD